MSRRKNRLTKEQIDAAFEDEGKTYKPSKIKKIGCPICYSNELELIDLGQGILQYCNSCKHQEFKKRGK